MVAVSIQSTNYVGQLELNCEKLGSLVYKLALLPRSPNSVCAYRENRGRGANSQTASQCHSILFTTSSRHTFLIFIVLPCGTHT